MIADNFANSCSEAVEALKSLCPSGSVEFVQCDLSRDNELLSSFQFDAVIHFAALKAVGESVEKPVDYYLNNLNSLLQVLKVCVDKNVKNFVFSSSATVYQPSEKLLREDAPLGASNPYGWSKVFGEQIVQDVAKANPDMKFSLLRYFNPIGAHPSGTIGESPEAPKNILPIIQKVAVGKMECINVAGNDWPTRDGTGVRDYIDVNDLAHGHVLALDHLYKKTSGTCDIYNLGTGTGVSVLEMIEAFKKASGKDIPYKIAGRRPGDLATVVCDPSKAQKELGFKATRSLNDSCTSAWKWQSSHPDGFKTKA